MCPDISKEITAPRIATDIAMLKETLSLAGTEVGTRELIQTYLDLDDSVTVLLLSAQQLAVAEDVLAYKREEAKKATGDYRRVVEGVADAERTRDAAAQNLVRTYETLTRAQRVTAVPQVQIFDVGKLTAQQVQMGVEMAQAFTMAEKLAMADGQEEVAGDYA